MKTRAAIGPRTQGVLYGVSAVLWLSGAVWLWAPAPLWLKLHGAAAMGFLAVFGALLASHVPAGWSQGRQRPSGVGLVASCAVLILSGWALYYCAEPVRDWAGRAHTFLGLASPAIVFLHVFRSKFHR